MFDRIHTFGILLAAYAVVMAVFSFFLAQNMPLTLLGLGFFAIGAFLIMTPVRRAQTETIRALLEGSILNVESVIKQLSASKKGYFVPKEDGTVLVYAPLEGGEESPPTGQISVDGFIARANNRSYLLLYPPTSFMFTGINIGEDFEGSLQEYLVESTKFAEDVHVTYEDNKIMVEIINPNAKPVSETIKKVVGSTEASLVATILAVTKKKTVWIESEEDVDTIKFVKLRLF
ncbi:MAG: hypothetical protein QXJ17_02825 [Nitrososphaeria archaeon]